MSKKWGVGRGSRKIELSDDELMHWKYIKRVKLPNGKYRYYYDYASTTRGDYEKATNHGKELEKQYKAEYILAREKARLIKENKIKNDGKYKNWNPDNRAEFAYDNYKHMQSLNSGIKAHFDNYKRNSSLNYKIDKIIEKVGIKTANSLNKAANTVDKAKKWLNNLFKKK